MKLHVNWKGRKMNFRIPILALAVTFGGMNAAQAEELRVLSAWDAGFVFNQNQLQPLLETITAETNGEITFSVYGPEVVSTFEQFEPVQSGAFDMLFAHPGYFTGNAGVGVTIDAIDPDPTDRRDTGIWDYLDEYYAQHGMKLIALPPFGEGSLLFVMQEGIPKTDQPFAGLKLRANVTYHELVKRLGGAPVLMSGGEIYAALQAGLIDGAAWSVVGVTDFKLNEVAGYWTEPSYGQTGTTLLMNLDRWNSLSGEVQDTIEDAAIEAELATMDLYRQLNDQERVQMKDAGMAPTRFSDEIAGNLDAYWAEGVWQLGMDKAGEDAAAFRAFAAEKGMTSASE